MKLMRRWETLTPRYVTFSCHRRLALLGRAEWRDVFVASLVGARERCGFALWAWVVMPEHVHLVIVPTEAWPVDRVMRVLKQPVAEQALGRWKEMGAPVLEELRVGEGYRYWQAGGGFDRNVRDMDELHREIEYIHQNPVARGLVTRDVDWAWSSARWYARWEGEIEMDEIGGWTLPKSAPPG